MTTPFLTLDERLQYLQERRYTAGGEPSQATIEFLKRTNFHYFLGYARNFRALVQAGKVDGDQSLDRVVGLIQIDHAVATRLFAALQQLEWRLRAHLVEHHCEIYASTSCFLDSAHFRLLQIDGRPTDRVVREQSVRSREPYILELFENYASRNGFSTVGVPDSLPEVARDDVLRTIPIWALVDGWSLGLLARVTMSSIAPQTDPGALLWKRVAGAFEISGQMFDTQLTSMLVLRNQVAHHARLWMRPTSNSPKIPKAYARVARDCHPKSMYAAWLALAAFLRKGGGSESFLDEISALADADPVYSLGVRWPIQS